MHAVLGTATRRLAVTTAICALTGSMFVANHSVQARPIQRSVAQQQDTTGGTCVNVYNGTSSGRLGTFPNAVFSVPPAAFGSYVKYARICYFNQGNAFYFTVTVFDFSGANACGGTFAPIRVDYQPTTDHLYNGATVSGGPVGFNGSAAVNQCGSYVIAP